VRRTQRTWYSIAIALGTIALTGTAPAASAASAAARPVSDCRSTSGAIVVVDFAHWGGPLLRACGSTPTTGFVLLNQGGWHTSGTVHDGPGFVCRIGYAGFRHGTQYPTPQQEACVNTPPASAYWTYWAAGPGQNTWNYSQVGAMTQRPPAGSVSLWIFGSTNVSGSSGSAKPEFSPDSVRDLAPAVAASDSPGSPPVVNAPPMTASQRTSRGSDRSVLITVAIVAAIAVAGFAGAWRRRRRERAT
jgi:hypothetical protein